MTAEHLEQEQWASARAGADDAGRVTTRLLEAGVSRDRIADLQHDTAARLLSEAQTSAGRAHAAAFDDTSRSLLADLRDDAGRAGRGPEAASLPDGTPHPDRFLAARGWQTDRGVYVRREAQAAPVADREAC